MADASLVLDLETDDPIAALDDKSIAVRAAACRDLSKAGRVEHLERLGRAAAEDKSPAVRLGTAAAAADILSRHRRSPEADVLDAAGRKEVLGYFRRVDPRLNPGIFGVYACLDTEAGVRRIGIGLRDPRGEVRVGAGVGLLRLCLSATRLGDTALEDTVIALLTDRRLKPDAVAEVARTCMSAGYLRAVDTLERVDVGGNQQVMVDAAIGRLAESGRPKPGVWWSTGRDAGETIPAAPREPGMLVVTEAGAAQRFVGAGWFDVDLSTRAWRPLFYRRSGEAEPTEAIQVGEHTFHATTSATLLDGIDALLPILVDGALEHGAHPLAHPALLDALDDTPVATRARALLLSEAGRHAEAIDAADSALGKRKAPADIPFVLGLLHERAGDSAAAAQAFAACVSKARVKKAPHVLAAKARLDA